MRLLSVGVGGIVLVLISAVLFAWVTDDGVRTVRVFVAPELADEVEVSEWMDRPLYHRHHSDGRVEYFGKSGPAIPERKRRENLLGNAGVYVDGFYPVAGAVAFWKDVPRGRELVIHLRPEQMPQVKTRPAGDGAGAMAH